MAQIFFDEIAEWDSFLKITLEESAFPELSFNLSFGCYCVALLRPYRLDDPLTVDPIIDDPRFPTFPDRHLWPSLVGWADLAENRR
jgi:hypothetical protein